ncbi:MAG: vitamin B12-dependent ribonucleotide reductase [Candidatus Alcyoniella australis]|nr:vitamin B12-dependent ribonucleotide reductase [Candidatus Alcyoniella australis]
MPKKKSRTSKVKTKAKAASDSTLPLNLEQRSRQRGGPLEQIKSLLSDHKQLADERTDELSRMILTELQNINAQQVPDSLVLGLADALELQQQGHELGLSDNALTVLRRRYLRRDENGQTIETPGEMFQRVATAVAAAEASWGGKREVERWRKRFLELMVQRQFLPNSPTLMNAGRENGQLSACFVLPVGDSMESIFEAVKNTALIHKTGGGTGFSFSRIRPKNDRVASTAGISSGPLSFMSVFNTATETVKQGGARRGANMAVLRVDHPDIIEFITAKRDLETLTNFNVSVALTDAFWKALERDGEYELINPRSNEAAGKLRARTVFELIVNMAWSSGEPGLVFIDRINQFNPTPQVGLIESTNPCGEQPLLPYEACNLGSINLAQFASGAQVDMERLGQVVRDAVRFLDDVIEVNCYPLEQIRETTLANRKIGLGVMGFADLLIKLGIPYDSTRALKLGEKIAAFIRKQAREAGAELAEQRGKFPNWEKSVFKKQNLPQRNATLTTIAPTGTISIIAGCSSGIEPLFAVSYFRKVLDGDELAEVHPEFLRIAREQGFASKRLLDKLASSGSLAKVPGVPDDLRRLFVTAHEVKPEWHVKMQAAFQKHVDNAVSKTVNLPQNAKPEDVAQVYRLAHKLGCKGCTVYRYGSRESVLNIGAPGTKSEKPAQPLGARSRQPRSRSIPRERDKVLRGYTELYDTGCGKLYVTVNRDIEGLSEVFTSTGRRGGCPSQSEAISRLVSLALRCGVNPEAIVDQLKGIRCYTVVRRASKNGPEEANGSRLMSCPAAISQALVKVLNASEVDAPGESGSSPLTDERQRHQSLSAGVCPDCGGLLAGDGGCVICPACGFSRCG